MVDGIEERIVESKIDYVCRNAIKPLFDNSEITINLSELISDYEEKTGSKLNFDKYLKRIFGFGTKFDYLSVYFNPDKNKKYSKISSNPWKLKFRRNIEKAEAAIENMLERAIITSLVYANLKFDKTKIKGSSFNEFSKNINKIKMNPQQYARKETAAKIKRLKPILFAKINTKKPHLSYIFEAPLNMSFFDKVVVYDPLDKAFVLNQHHIQMMDYPISRTN